MSLIHFRMLGNYENTDYLRNILKEISQLQTPNIMTILGDNYYPVKENKQKILNKKHFHDLQTLSDTSISAIPTDLYFLEIMNLILIKTKKIAQVLIYVENFIQKSKINLVKIATVILLMTIRDHND